MNSGSAVGIGAELPVVYAAVAVLALLILVLLLYTKATHKPTPPLAQALAVVVCATVCVILVSFASSYFPGTIDAKTTSIGPFTFDAQGQLAIFAVALVAIYSATAVVVTFVFKHIPALPPEPIPVERPRIFVEIRERPRDDPQMPTHD